MIIETILFIASEINKGENLIMARKQQVASFESRTSKPQRLSPGVDYILQWLPRCVLQFNIT